ncbi:MAG: PTS sugar transporter subunit IIA [Anaerolineales bacterium]|jgi:PTS system galactitol-specific IIA component
MKALGDLLVDSAIVLNFQAKNAEDVVNVLGECLEEAGFVKDSFVQAALTREKTMPTGLPLQGKFNAAIPHTDIEHVNKAGVALATLTQPVIFQNMANPEESVSVQLVFLLALDQPKAQIEMLQEIAGVLQNPELIERIMSSQDSQEVLNIFREI